VANNPGVPVAIYGQVYHIRPTDGSDPQQVEQLAHYVDVRMRAIAAKTRDVDSLRVAVLAALHIADEYHSLKSRYEALLAAVSEKSRQLARTLDSEIRKAQAS